MRKTVTVLFADIGGSTGFGERTDPEVSRQVLARYHALLQDAIDAHRGTVAKFMGDGMMATFGIPEIAEDDAERAVRAGIDIQDRFARFAAEVTTQYGETLTARVGINTGEVVIGAGDADLIGDALNVAARLEKACRPGHVLVGDDTWRLTRGALAYDALGEVTVAGRAEPVGTYEVATSETQTAEPVAPFVGRDSELERLLACLDRARTEHTAILATVLGSPGLGKTRLSRELATHAGDAATFEIRCDRAGGSTFAPIADLIRTAAGIEDSESDGDGTAVRTRIGTLLEGASDRERIVDVLAGVLGAAPARSVEETFWAVRRTLEALAAEQPLLVVVDDIQWAEPKLLDLIEHLGEWVTDAPVLVVSLARPELRELRPSLVETGRRVADVVALDGLDSGATEALAAGLLGSPLPRELVDRLPRSTDGNPLFVRELVRMLVDDSVIRRRDDGTWELAIDADAVEVPPTIQSLLSTRVERLPADELHLLELASVVGAEFSIGALRDLGADDLPIVTLLERMRRQELVEPTGAYWGDEPIYRFHHVLIRDAAYRRLLKGRRAELHQRVAEGWNDAAAGQLIGEHESAIAFHYEQAHRYRTELGVVDDDTDELGHRAASLFGVAAHRALDRDDLAAAGALVRRALAVLPASETATRSDLLLMACECLLASGDVAAGAPLVEELSELGIEDEQLRAWAACFRAQLVGLTDPTRLVDAEADATAAAETLRELGDGAGEAKAQQVRALVLARLGRVGEAEAVLDLALGAARAVDDRRRVTAVLGAAPQAALFGPSPVARAGGRCLDVVRLLRITTASPSVEATSMRCQAVLEALRGRFDVSRSMLASARASLEELGLRHGLLETDLYTGIVELLADDPGAAVAPLRAAYEGMDTLGVGADAGQAAALLATALLAQGEIDEAELTAAASEALAGQNLKTAIAWRTAKAAVLAARGELAAAVALARRAVDIAAATDLVLDHADACVVLADLREEAGDTVGAREARAEALRLYEAKGATVPAERLQAATRAPAVAPTAPAHSEPPSNRASRAFERATALMHGDVDQAVELFADDIAYETRESGPRAAIESTGRAALRAVVTSLASTFDAMTVEPIAVRGERCALTAHALSSTGFSVTALCVVELDAEGLISRLITFDDDDLQAALDELDERYLAGEGADDAARVRAGMRAVGLARDRDWDGYRNALHPDLRFVDHRLLGFPETDRDGLIEINRSFPADPSMTPIVRSLDRSGHASMVSLDITVPGGAGGDMHWSMLMVSIVDDDGLVRRLEWFAPEDRAAAIARMEELGAPRSSGPTLENAATRAGHAAITALDQYLRTGTAQPLDVEFADDFVMEDRRTIVAMPTQGRDDLTAVFATMREQGYLAVSEEVIAIRGDRLALAARSFETTTSARTSSLSLIELDDQGRVRGMCLFDGDDLTAAMVELDRRYITAEGAEHVRVLRVCGALNHASVSGDTDRLRALLSPDMRMVDHREIGLYTGDLHHYLAMTSRDEFSSFEIFTRTLEIVGSTVLATHDERLQTHEGSDYDYGPGCTLLSLDTDDRVCRMEWWPGDRYEEARARLHQLEGSELRLENAATRATDEFARRSAIDMSSAVELLTADYVRTDRRRTVAAEEIRGPAAMRTSLEAMQDLGFVLQPPEVIAIRGDRLSLGRARFRTDGGDELDLLGISETDENERIASTTWYDADDVAAAVEELDRRYLEGEGAGHAVMLQANDEVVRLAREHDWDGHRQRLAEDFVLVDHRTVGLGTTDREGYLSFVREYATTIDEIVTYASTVQFAGSAMLASTTTAARTVDGTPWEYAMHAVVVADDSGRVHRLEWFEPERGDAAVARLHDLGATEATGPVIENTVSRTMGNLLQLINAGDWDAALETHAVAVDVVRLDRRKLVSAPPIEGIADFALNAAGFLEVFDHVEPEVVAVRGDRLALVRLHCGQEPDFVLRILCLYECDADGKLEWEADYDDEDLADALAELDRRFIAGEGVSDERVLRICLAFGDANERRDFDAMREMLAADFVMDDRTSLGYGEGDRDYFDVSSRTRADVSPADGISISRLVQVDGNALLTLAEGHHITPEGSDYAWVSNIVFQVGDDGLIHRAEYFDEDAFATAVDRLHELGIPAVPPLGNRASRVQQSMVVGNDASGSTEFVAPDFRFEDRRSVVNLGPTDAAGLQRNLTMMRDQGYVILTPEVVAIRGERHSLVRRTARTPSGDESVVLAVGEIDDSDRYSSLVFFDADDLDTALDELDERFATGEGAEHAYLIRRMADLRLARAVANEVAIAELFAPGVVDALADVPIVPRSIEILGDTMLLRASGADDSSVRFLVLHLTAGVFDGMEVYGREDEGRARGRFDELARAPRGPAVDNRLIRLLHRYDWLYRHVPDPARTASTYSPDVVLDDRRAGVNAGEVVGDDAVAASINTGTEVFGRLHIEPMAARGDRLGLFHWAYRQEGGFEAPGLTVVEMDDADRVVAVTSFDESDLAAAVDHLEERHRELSGSEYGPIDRLAAVGEHSLNHRDFDAFEQTLAPGFTAEDHRQLGMSLDRQQYLEYLRVLIEQAPDFTFFFAQPHVVGEVAITTVPFFGTTPEGSRYEWSYIQVSVVHGGQGVAFELFDEGKWDEAVARFEELAADNPEMSAPPPLGNTATRLIDHASSLMWTDLEAALDHFAPDAAGIARESGPSRDLVATNREMWRDVLSSFAHTYDEVHFTPLAVRGEHLALVRQEFRADGYALLNLTVLATDERNHIRIIETFGEDELDRAMARLDELDRAPVQPMTPTIDNAALQTLLRGSALRTAGDLEAANRLVAPDVAASDARTTVSMPDAEGRSDFGTHIRSTFEVFDTEQIEPIAVRGERAVLARVRQEREGFAVTFLTTWLVDEEHRLWRGAIFEESDLAGALAALETQHLESLGDSATPVDRALGDASIALLRHDSDGYARQLLSDVESIDHLPQNLLSAFDAQQLTRILRRLFELAPDTVFVATKVSVEPRASLAVVEQRTTTPHGTHYVWIRNTVQRFDADGRVERIEHFAEDRWDDAVARFDEWSA